MKFLQMEEDAGGGHELRLAFGRDDLPCYLGIEESGPGLDAARIGHCRQILGPIHAQHPQAMSAVTGQPGAIVATDIND